MASIFSAFVANLPRPPKASERESTNVITLFRSLTALQWGLFLSGWLAWTVDAIDFFSVSLSNSRLSKQFDKPLGTITTSITLTLLFRPVGAILFGLMADRYGRKWPLIVDLICCGALSLGTSFVKDFSSFLAVRSLFGVAMGGIWGGAVALALENMPVEARGLFSGILQQGYAVGYLLSCVVNLTAVADHSDWRILFWFGAGASFFAAFVRLLLPESAFFLERRAVEKASGNQMSSGQKSKQFMREAGKAIKLHWRLCIFSICLMTGFNFFSHGSQDVFPSYIQDGKGLSAHSATLATISGNCGAIAGGTIAGYVSQFLGRRLTIIVMCIWTCCFIPLWYLPNSLGGLAAGAFFVQFGVQGAWGVVPIYLSEMSPPAFRAVFPGLAYQLGNMVSSSSAQIEATAGGNIKTAEGRPDYGKVGAILISVVAGWLIACCLIGKEQHGAHFEHGKAAYETGAGAEEYDEGDDQVGPLPKRFDLEKANAGETIHRENTNTTTASSMEKASIRT